MSYRKCNVKGCLESRDFVTRVGSIEIPVCADHHEAMFELGKKFNTEYNDLERKYFKLALHLKKEG